jgi:hypothetical protein
MALLPIAYADGTGVAPPVSSKLVVTVPGTERIVHTARLRPGACERAFELAREMPTQSMHRAGQVFHRSTA